MSLTSAGMQAVRAQDADATTASYAPPGMVEAAISMERAWKDAAYVAAEATGIAVDDPNDPHAAVAVHDGQIVYMGISDSLLSLGADQLTDIINGLIVIAFSNWRAQMTTAR